VRRFQAGFWNDRNRAANGPGVTSAAVPIVIRRTGESYVAEVTPPHGEGKPWSSPHPMTRDDLVAALRQIGCHQTDIGDAFFEADPGWLHR
jgi:hypothetical protein